ncbi:mitochondrial outer membrane protein SLC25A46 isoform X2 [Anabrus simplex]|uniref:mitochondrial outer membrane protein SLC25A46 isoform X2 n=1 Tax=Anabrus simplex TaxID=316456 RepID=UPI0035A2FB82
MAGIYWQPEARKDGDDWNNGQPDNYCAKRILQSPTEVAWLPSKPLDVSDLEEDDDLAVKRYVGLGVGLVSLLTENLLSHPFVVLRRQCQVNNNSRRYHLIPITLIPVILRLHQRQGITTLWKGLGSVLLVRGMSLGLEDFISKVTPWPKEISWRSSFKSMGQHILLKCTSLVIITPFYSASLVETVQSEIASERPGMFNVFKEGICRLVSWGAPQKGRMLPVWSLVVPTVMYGLMKYLFGLMVQRAASHVIHAHVKHRQLQKGALSRDLPPKAVLQELELTSTLIGLFTAEVVFYPLETVLHRLHLQGTRTIIDNLDSGAEVIPILTSYEGASDCFSTIVQEEGFLGLYKGFGSLLIQCAAHIAVIRLTKFVLTEVVNLLRTNTKSSSPPPPTDMMAPGSSGVQPRTAPVSARSYPQDPYAPASAQPSSFSYPHQPYFPYK